MAEFGELFLWWNSGRRGEEEKRGRGEEGKLSILIVLVALSGLHEATGQWNASGSNIYNTNSGYAGIGNDIPGSLLYVGIMENQ